jgi:hypothetical protein
LVFVFVLLPLVFVLAVEAWITAAAVLDELDDVELLELLLPWPWCRATAATH